MHTSNTQSTFSPEKLRYREKKRFSLRTILFIITLALILLAAVATFIYRQINLHKNPVDPNMEEYFKAKQKADELSTTVSKFVTVPKDETPDVATVTNVEELQNQDFFKEAQNGDKILIYAKHKLAVLYRPSENRVITIAPVLYNQLSPSPSASPSASLTPIKSTPSQNN